MTAADGSTDVAIAMIEAEATDNAWTLIKNEGVAAPTETVVAEGIEASKPFIKALCDAQVQLAAQSAKETQEFKLFPDYQDDSVRSRRGRGLRVERARR